jgi:hypothetical protein
VTGTTHGARRHGTGTRNTIVSAITRRADLDAIRRTNREMHPEGQED